MRRSSIILLLIASPSLGARSQSVSTVTVRGTVVDAASSLALGGARLTLTSVTPAVLPPQGPSSALTTSRVTTTDSAGGYEITGIPAGEYRLFVRRLGYQPQLMDLDVRNGSTDARLSFGLVVVPVRLERIQVDGFLLNTFGRLYPLTDGDDDTASVIAARARATEFLGTDVRELTNLGSLEAGAIGETDVFRATRRLPGVTGPDERSAELWVRGARWDQVRISYDGMPLFNPFHASETVAAISPDAIGAAFLHPGVRPVSLMDQGPSLIDIRSRSAADSGSHWRGGASRRDFNLVYERTTPDRSGGLVATGRRSFKDLVDFPFAIPLDHDVVGKYSEFTLRADRDLGAQRSIELSALKTKDEATYRTGPSNSAAGDLPVSSGTFLYRLTLNKTSGRVRRSHTFGYSDYSTNDVSNFYPQGVIDTATQSVLDYTAPGGHYIKTTNVSYMTLRGDFRANTTSNTTWNAGYQYYRYHTSSFALRHEISWSDLSHDHFNLRQTRQAGAIWGEGRWTPLTRLTLDGGLRIESHLEAMEPRLAPSAQVRFRLDRMTSLSLGASRTFQDAQELPFTSASLRDGRGFWILSGSGFPTLRADQASAGLERWLGSGLVFDANVFGRRLKDVAVRPLPQGDSLPHPIAIPSTVDAKGMELGLRKLAGRFTGSLGYTLGKSTERIEGVTYPGSGDRTHSVDATAMFSSGRYRVGSAFTYMSGAPYTRGSAPAGIYLGPDAVHWTSLASAQERNAERLPAFASVDLFMERASLFRGRTVTPYFGIQNLLGRASYTGYWFRAGDPARSFFSNDLVPTPEGRRVNFGFRIVF